MELAPKQAIQILFIVIVGVIFMPFAKSYANDTILNTTTTTQGLWEQASNPSGV